MASEGREYTRTLDFLSIKVMPISRLGIKQAGHTLEISELVQFTAPFLENYYYYYYI